MRVGLLGGSFNPVHNAHLTIADRAERACDLQRIIFIPAADPPHKPIAGDVSFTHRARMVQLAIAGRSDFQLSTIEAERGGKSYSIDTIQAFRTELPASELFFIIGGDSFLELGSWHRYEDIFVACNRIVVERPGHTLESPYDRLPPGVKGCFAPPVAGESRLRHHSGTAIHFITGEPLELSSTEIRRQAAAGADISRFVQPYVAAYISQQRIYHQCQ